MRALENLIADVLVDVGIERTNIRTRTALELPGYFRPEKQWDLLVVVNDQLLVAIEFKSHIGPSFGNNFNNRIEEAIGNSEDVLTAYREGGLGNHLAPFLGWLMLLEDCPAVHRPIRSSEPHYEVDPVFKNSSYARRYEIFCQRLLLERKYNSSCLILATNATSTEITSPSALHGFRQFAVAVEGHARTFLNLL